MGTAYVRKPIRKPGIPVPLFPSQVIGGPDDRRLLRPAMCAGATFQASCAGSVAADALAFLIIGSLAGDRMVS